MRATLAVVALAACAPGSRTVARGVLAYDVAVAGDLVASLELETTFALVLRRAGRVVRVPLGPPESDMVDVCVDARGRVAAVAGLDGEVRVIDAVTGALRTRFRLDAAATAVALSPDGAYLATGAASGAICLRRVDDGALLQCVAEHASRVGGLAAAGDVMVSGDAAGHLVVWRLPALRVVKRRNVGAAISAVALSPDGARLAYAQPPVAALAVTPRGLARAAGREVSLAGKVLGRFPGPLRGLAVSEDGRSLYVAGFTSRDLKGASLSVIALP